MTQEEKHLLFVDLSARLPYKPMLHICDGVRILEERLTPHILSNMQILFVQPYLRPISSMTEEEKEELEGLNMNPFSGSVSDWLNAHYFDYRDLIPIGLALEASEGMYNIN